MILAGLATMATGGLALGLAASGAAPATSATSPTVVAGKIDPGDWPQWRGPNRDGVSDEKDLLDEWPAGGPPLLWRMTGCGNGVAGIVTCKGRLYVMGDRDKSATLQCYDLATQKQIWYCRVAPEFGMGERAAPVVDGNQIFGCTGNSTFYAVDGTTGKLMWSFNARRDLHGDMQHMYGYSETPLVDGDRVICTPGAKDAMMIAVDRNTGKIIWKLPAPMVGPNGGADLASYASAVISNGGGVKQYVQLIARGLIGVRASDGKLLWGYNRIAISHSNIPTPMISGDYVVCANGYQSGTCGLKLSPDGDGGVKATELWFLKPDVCQNLCGQSVLVGDYMYTGHGHYAGIPMCVNFKTGQVMWKAENEPGTGVAGLTAADGKLIFRSESNLVSLVAADPKEYRLISTFTPDCKKPSYAHPVVSHGLLFIRQDDLLLAYDLRKH
jgi:outer membrane protein assembly factor BamB